MVSIDSLYQQFRKYRKVTTDSRNVPVGAIFFALKGERFDGNRFVQNAFDKGASFAVVDDPSAVISDQCLLVPDVLDVLQKLGMKHRAQLTATLIGITGSNGKTTTKELICTVLQKKYKTQATTGNLNNHIGVPLTLLAFPDDLEFGIVEMGANHIGEIAILSGLANPGFGIITNVGKAHLEGFGSFQGVVKAKTELYRHLKNNGGTVFVNALNPILMERSEGLSRVLYGQRGNPVHGFVLKSYPLLSVNCTIGSENLILNTRISGTYNLENILAAVSIGHHFDVGLSDIRDAIEGYTPSNNRSQVIRTQRNTLIMDAYNANPTSMEAALRHFAGSEYSNKVLILGEMFELGEDTEKEHQKILHLIRELGLGKVLLVGAGFKLNQFPEFVRFDTTQELMEALRKDPVKDAAILIKGSRGNKLEQILDCL